jgi:UDP-glucose 4-epimerase
VKRETPTLAERPSAGRVLVTGATGFLGAGLVRRLADAAAEVHALSRRPPDGTGRVRWWRGDVEDEGTVRRLFHDVRPEVVFHLAGDAIGRREREWVGPLLRAHVLGTVNVLDAAVDTEVRRVVMTASMEEPEPTDGWARPSSPYAAAKWASSGYARMFQALYGAPVVLLRVFMVYGPGRQDLRKLIPHVALTLLAGEAPQLSSGGRQVDWVYLDDVVDALLAAAEAGPEAEGTTIDVGSGHLISIRDLVGEIVRIVGTDLEPRFGSLPERAMEQVRAADPRQAWTTLGWEPRTPLPEGLRRTIDWYRSHPTTRLEEMTPA